MSKKIKDFDLEIQSLERDISRLIRLYSSGSSDVNKLISQNDKEFLELVKDYIANDLYEKYKNDYVVIDEYNSLIAIYNKVDKNDADAFSYTVVLDRELLHINTCIKIMEQNDNQFAKFIDIFNYDCFREYYNYLFTNVKQFIVYYNSYIEKIFNEDDINNILAKLNIDELLVFKCYSEAVLELPSVINIKEDSVDKDTYIKVNELIESAYNKKLQQVIINDVSRTRFNMQI